MKNNIFYTVIILLAVTFVSLQSCEKKELNSTEIESEEVESPIYDFSKEIIIADKSGTSAVVTVYSDIESALHQEITIIPQYKKPVIENIVSDENTDEVEFSEKAQVYFEIEDVKLPKNAIGFSISHKTTNKWDATDYAYGSSYDGVNIVKTNSRGYTKYKVDVLYTGSQWWYETLVKGKLRSNQSAAQGIPGSYYKMRLRISNYYGSTCTWAFWKW